MKERGTILNNAKIYKTLKRVEREKREGPEGGTGITLFPSLKPSGEGQEGVKEILLRKKLQGVKAKSGRTPRKPGLESRCCSHGKQRQRFHSGRKPNGGGRSSGEMPIQSQPGLLLLQRPNRGK